MTELFDPPPERDLPARQVTRMRAELLNTISRPQRRPTRLRVAVVAATAVVAVSAVLLVGRPGLPGAEPSGGFELVAMGPTELSPTLHKSVEQCLDWNAQEPLHTENSAEGGGASEGGAPGASWPAVTEDDLAVAAQRDDTAALLFLTEAGYLTCDVRLRAGRAPSGGLGGVAHWPQRDWLPGPVQWLSLSSTEADGGDVAVSGRISARVHRLVLEHGDGGSTTARLASGVFGLVTKGAEVNRNAELVSYDADRNEIDRRLLVHGVWELEHCYVDPSGQIINPPVVGEDEPHPEPPLVADCRPAERWTR
ncbi:hypothetical protein [Salinispora sp. H7-4]|uniref:hypothetical protein n=1 Tax=Salinispora sp. H7-4 TaxID=2748321 RepID=UPI0015D23A52|nr:hypothetical protein [Salinispora sp. H7-4]NYT96797.1 hypothetical protein [Salinispora sp. H7-4]